MSPIALFFLALTTVIGALCFRYELCWAHPEFTTLFVPAAVRKISPFVQAFDFTSYDGYPRARFLSYFFTVLNVQFRNWVFGFIPPHPSFSITWVVSLGLAPIFLFRFVRDLTGKPTTAWTACALYICSTGFLSGLTMLFHPAKPLASFLYVFAFYYVGRSLPSAPRFLRPSGFASGSRNDSLPVISCDSGKAGVAQRSWCARQSLTQLWFILLAGFYLDEVCWFLPLALKIFFPNEFRGKRFFAFLILLPLVFFLSTLIYPGSSFWDFSLRTNAHLRHFDPAYLRANLWALFSHPFSGVILLGLFFPRGILVCVAYAVFHTLLLTRHMQFVASPYYYGAPFSFFLCVTIAVSLGRVLEDLPKLATATVAALMLLSLQGFLEENLRWKESHLTPYEAYFLDLTRSEGLTRREVTDLWKQKAKLPGSEKEKVLLNPKSYWFFAGLVPEKPWRFWKNQRPDLRRP